MSNNVNNNVHLEYMLPVKSVLRLNLFLPRLNTHSDELKKPFLEPKLRREKDKNQVRMSFGYYIWISIDLTGKMAKYNSLFPDYVVMLRLNGCVDKPVYEYRNQKMIRNIKMMC